MSRTKKSKRPSHYDYGSKRPPGGYPPPGPKTKKRTHKSERKQGQEEIKRETEAE